MTKLNKDVGEFLPGSVKDVRQRNQALDVLDINSKDDFKKSEDFPKLNFAKEHKAGRNVNVLAAFLAADHVIKTKPQRKHLVDAWNRNFKALLLFLESIESEESEVADGDVGRYFIESRARTISTFPGLLNRVSLYMELGYPCFMSAKKCSIGFFNALQMDDGTIGGYMYSGVTGNRDYSLRFKTYEDAVGALKSHIGESISVVSPSKKLLKFDIRQKRVSGEFIITHTISGVRSPYVVKGGFDDLGKVRQYLNDNVEALDAQVRELKDKAQSTKGYLLKLSDTRDGKHWTDEREVSSEELRSLIHLRGLEYGIQMSEKDALKANFQAYNGFMDLADVLGLPLKALGLGDLGLGLGSRGKGGKNAACAHFEPCNFNINLTKKAGAGSFAHEWAHAVDALLGAYAHSGQRTHRVHALFASELCSEVNELPDDISNSLCKVMDEISKSKVKERSAELDKFRSKPYWTQGIEIFARSFERWVSYELEKEGFYNGWLIRLNKSREGEDEYPYPTVLELESGIADAFREFAKALSANTEVLIGEKCLDSAPVVAKKAKSKAVSKAKSVTVVKTTFKPMSQNPTQLSLLAV